jgi:Nucleotidyl transferase AbiEii toxin, Type IV TA system
MELIQENSKYYASPVQREVPINLITHPDIEKSFFLTGDTALSVFFLHHRTSQDLDLFTRDDKELGEIDQWI